MPKIAKKEAGTATQTKRPLAVMLHDGSPHIFYLSIKGKTETLCLAPSTDGVTFKKVCIEAEVLSAKKKKVSLKNCRDFKISRKSGGYFLTYTRRRADVYKIESATSRDLKKWQTSEDGSVLPRPGILAPSYKHDDSFVLYYGDYAIKTATSKDLKKWRLGKHLVLSPRAGHFDNGALDILSVQTESDGIYVLYDASFTKNNIYHLQIGGAIFSLEDPEKLLWRSDLPLFAETIESGNIEAKATSLGGLFLPKNIMLYWIFGEKGLHTLSIPRFTLAEKAAKPKGATALERKPENPIIKPRAENGWESEATFNPAAVNIDDKIHMLYRSVGRDGVSYLGYAGSRDGVNFSERFPDPAYFPREAFEGAKPADKSVPKLIYYSGGGWNGGGGGCEDPRLTQIGDTVYMIYTAFDGWGSLRLALTSIKTEDLKNKNWHWKKAVLISPPNQINKNWVLFPEKINGKFAILHSVAPEISISYLDDLDFADGNFVKSKFKSGLSRAHAWDNQVRGAGPPPLKTEFGWLLFYHAMDRRDPNRYKIGAMMLDLKDPTKVLYRSKSPVLEPNMSYENQGFKAGVVYSCGAVLKNNDLFIYYGGADTVSCVASAPLDTFLGKLAQDKEVKMERKPVII